MDNVKISIKDSGKSFDYIKKIIDGGFDDNTSLKLIKALL